MDCTACVYVLKIYTCICVCVCKHYKVKINFDISKYEDLLGCMHSISLEELIMAVRRQSQVRRGRCHAHSQQAIKLYSQVAPRKSRMHQNSE
jgi:hypothetical protein